MTDTRPRWLGWTGLAHDAVDGTTELVGVGRASVSRAVHRWTRGLAPEVAAPIRLVDTLSRTSTGGVLGSVRGVNRAVELLLGAAVEALADPRGAPPLLPLRSDLVGSPAWLEDAALGLINGALGDHLRGRTASLDLGLRLRAGDQYLPDAPAPREDQPSLVILVHGVATTEWSWCLDAEAYHGDPAATFGTMLARDLGLEPIYVRYDTGRSVATNGAALAARLAALAEAWRPARIVLLGHSMGGLVSRSACRAAQREEMGWLAQLSDLVSLGTPWRGSPWADAADVAGRTLGAVDHPATGVLARILETRSAGLQDLSDGAPETEAGPLPPHVRQALLSATLTADPAHPVGALIGDLLVRVSSASDGDADATLIRHTLGGVLHHQIQCHPEVYALVLRLLTRAEPG